MINWGRSKNGQGWNFTGLGRRSWATKPKKTRAGRNAKNKQARQSRRANRA